MVAVGVVLAGCGGGSSPTVSKEALQADVAARLDDDGEAPRSVVCREDLVGEIGRTSRCDVVVDDTNSFQPIVTVTDVSGGTVSYEMTPALSRAQLEAAVARLVVQGGGPPVDFVACESGLVGNADAEAFCDVDAGGTRHRRTVRVTSVSGLTMNFSLTAG